MPEHVRIREVGPRDGFQNEPEVIATDDKVRLVELLARTGVQRLEVTSFVRADVIPQLADGAEVLRRADIPDDVAVTVLIPNERGLDNALELRDRFHEVNLFLSASETHNRKNVNRSIEESLSGLERVIARARDEGLRCEGVISVAFGCPYEGEVPRERVLDIARRLVDAGCEEIAFGDTTGMANPVQVERFFDGLDLGVELTGHFHNTRGQGLANVVGALAVGRAHLRVARSASWAAARCRRARPATSRPRTSSRCCTRWATRPASTSSAWSRRPARRRRCWAARSAATC